MTPDETPLIEGATVTFLWRGARPASLVGDFNYWDRGEPWQLTPAGPNLWTRQTSFPPDAYIEYAYILDGVRTPDPLNPRQVADGMGNVNSYLCMPEFVDTPLAVERPGTPRGAITRHEIPGNGHIAGAGRAVHLYQPPAAHPVPLLVVLDGSEYREKASLATIVDNLIHESRIVPLAMALADNGGQARVVEYACNDATVAFILQDVLDLARQRLNLLDVGQSPGAFGIMGASMGGLMSLYTALRAPEVFGHVLCESGAFGADRLYHRSVLYDLIRATDPPPLSIWMDVGLHEWFLHPNREIHRLLRDRGYRVAYREQTSGHNYPSWRNVLWRGLEHLFPR